MKILQRAAFTFMKNRHTQSESLCPLTLEEEEEEEGFESGREQKDNIMGERSNTEDLKSSGYSPKSSKLPTIHEKKFMYNKESIYLEDGDKELERFFRSNEI